LVYFAGQMLMNLCSCMSNRGFRLYVWQCSE